MSLYDSTWSDFHLQDEPGNLLLWGCCFYSITIYSRNLLVGVLKAYCRLHQNQFSFFAKFKVHHYGLPKFSNLSPFTFQCSCSRGIRPWHIITQKEINNPTPESSNKGADPENMFQLTLTLFTKSTLYFCSFHYLEIGRPYSRFVYNGVTIFWQSIVVF